MGQHDDLDATRTLASPVPESPRGKGERFLPGAVLAERYRVVGLVGRGGMGEVYRADDLKLGQAVALKFLPSEVESDEDRRERLFAEVRVARQVAHPNVCRVFDVGEVDGQPFISMEYVDGEDLASLLRRIGRLPREKAVQIARQLCAGLAAAHDQGILHRDLKPANVMIDGRGRVRVTDFGLAGLAGGFTGAETRAGTPLYMAPEQLAGEEVSVRSDLYALGLVLYELFTGERPFGDAARAKPGDSRGDSEPTRPSSHVEGLDAAVESAILRCLEPAPRDRPTGALAVAAALPGGDPLAAALAAGETPSPEMVAAAPTEGTLRPGVAVAWLATAVVLLTLVLLAFAKFGLGLGEKPPAVLVDRAEQTLEALGYGDRARDSAFGYYFDPGHVLYLDELDTETYRRVVTENPDAAIRFWYRASPDWLVPHKRMVVRRDDPPLDLPGMTLIVLDSDGRPHHFEAVPDREGPTGSGRFDPRTLFSTIGLDAASYEDAVGEARPPRFYADGFGAWRARDPAASLAAQKVEAAWRGGKATSVRVAGSWPESQDREVLTRPGPLFAVLLLVLQIIILVAGLLLVRRTLASGRGDRRGAVRLAVFFFGLGLLIDVLLIHHTPTRAEFGLLWRAIAMNCLLALVVWALYLGIEPFARRRWPKRIISWTRLLAGRFQDPLVGRDLLIGTAAGWGLVLLPWIDSWIRSTLSGEPVIGFPTGPGMAVGLARPTAAALNALGVGTLLGLGLLVLLLALSMLLRSDKLAGLVFWAMMTVGFAAAQQDFGAIPLAAALSLGILLLLWRGGLLLTVAAFLAIHIPVFSVFSFEPGSWYGPQALGLAALGLAPAVFGLIVSIDRRPSRLSEQRI